jgi:tetratricopeptide (TPR) repeat protein
MPSAAAASLAEPLWLQLAGVPALRQQGRQLNPGTRKALALAVLVALDPGLRRSVAADLLWPEADPAAARRNVRRDLFRLRQIGLAIADGAGETLTFEAARPFWPAPTVVPPRWLDGLDEVAGAEFAHWVELQRAQLQRRWLQHLTAQARGMEEAGELEAALSAWRALLSDGAAGPDHAEARAALQRIGSELPAGPAVVEVAAAAAGWPPRRPSPAAFQGREQQLAEIDAALARRQVVLIDGAPGVGKTRLALEALAPRGGVSILRCRPEDVAVPFASARRGLLALREAAPDVQPSAWVRRELAVFVPEWSGANRGAADPDSRGTERLRRAYHAAVQVLTEGNFAGVVLDDWQWADESSRSLWDFGAFPMPLPWLVVHRSGELPPPALQRRRRWLDDGVAAAVHVPPLADEAARALLVSLAAGGPAVQDLDQLVSRGAGNPLFLIETLRNAQQRGAAAVPVSVHEIVVARARALGPAVRRVLEAASLAGDELSAPVLAAVVGIDPLAAALALEHATVAELLGADARGRHRFAHDLIADAIAGSLSPVRRSALHGQLAAALAAAGAEPGQIARHLDDAGRPGEAAAWHLRAASVALQRQAWPQAVAASMAVVAASADPALRLDAQVIGAKARRRQSDIECAEAMLVAAVADAVRCGPERVIDLTLERIELLSHTGRAEQALAELAQLESDPSVQAAQRRRLLNERASALSFLGRHAQSLPQLRRLLDELPASALAERQRVSSVLARNLYWAGELDEARSLVEQALALSRSLGDPAAISAGLFRLGVLDRERGQLDRADAYLQEAAELSRRIGYIEMLRAALSTMCTTRLDQLRLDEAEALIVEGELAAPYWDSPDLEDVFDERRYRLHYLRGEVPQAWAVTQRSLDRNRAGAHLHSTLGTLMQAVRLALITRDTARARRHLDEAIALHAAAGADSLHGQELETHVVQVLHAEGHAEDALRRAEQWLAAPQTRRVEERARLLATAASAALDLGQAARAAAAIEQAVELPGVPLEVTALLLAARLRHARAGGAALEPALVAVHEWLAGAPKPALEAAMLERLLGKPARGS